MPVDIAAQSSKNERARAVVSGRNGKRLVVMGQESALLESTRPWMVRPAVCAVWRPWKGIVLLHASGGHGM